MKTFIFAAIFGLAITPEIITAQNSPRISAIALPELCTVESIASLTGQTVAGISRPEVLAEITSRHEVCVPAEFYQSAAKGVIAYAELQKLGQALKWPSNIDPAKSIVEQRAVLAEMTPPEMCAMRAVIVQVEAPVAGVSLSEVQSAIIDKN